MIDHSLAATFAGIPAAPRGMMHKSVELPRSAALVLAAFVGGAVWAALIAAVLA